MFGVWVLWFVLLIGYLFLLIECCLGLFAETVFGILFSVLVIVFGILLIFCWLIVDVSMIVVFCFYY